MPPSGRQDPRLWSRRDALKSSAALAAAACAKDPSPTPGRVDTIVILMLENRSFDHWFGGQSLDEGRTDIDGLTSQMQNLDRDGQPVSPFPSSEPCLIDPPHGWDESHAQWNEGKNDGFCTQYALESGTNGAGVMGYQTRADLPISWALADGGTLCDRYFASLMGPTWPNRFYGLAGTSDGRTNNDYPGSKKGFTGFPWMTGFHALGDAGVDWRYYYGNIPVLGLFDRFWEDSNVGTLDDFYRDAANGKLPPVVWLDPAFFLNDAHPPYHPALAEVLLGSIYEALKSSPHWESLLFFCCFDEHGGFFDHVPPPTIGDDDDASGFGQLGFRVPGFAMGPWVKQGVESTVLEHTSWIRMICDRYDIEPWNERIASTNSLEAVLDLDRLASGIPLDPVSIPPFSFDDEDLPESCARELPEDFQAVARRAVDVDLAVIPREEAFRRFVDQLRSQGLLSGNHRRG